MFNYQEQVEKIEKLEKLYSGVTMALDEVHEDFEHSIKMKVQYFIEDQLRDNMLEHEDGLAEPMPPLVFGEKMDQTLE